MASQHSRESRARELERLVNRLGEHASEFTPTELNGVAPAPVLPGRRPGGNLDAFGPPPTGAAAVILDCGTSRLAGYSHVLWISASAEAMLGSQGLERLSEAIGRLPGVEAYEWEGLDHLHLRADGSDWGDLLAGARAAYAALTS